MDINEPKLHYHCDEWMNDPKLFFWEGTYHVFFQYKWPRHWAHIRSTDLIHWEELPIALAPGEEGPDSGGGCFTGCCIRAYDQFHIFYTGSGKDGRQTTCHAVSDDLINWTKDPNNPIITASSPYNSGQDADWRDPQVWQQGDSWYMVQCGSLPERSGATKACIALMTSDDLANWNMLEPLHVSDGMMMCECPDVFPLDGKHVALFSCFKTFSALSDNVFGTYRMNQHVSNIDSDVLYAAKTLLDDKNRRLAWGFIFENCGWEFYYKNQSWSPALEDRKWFNALSFPREMNLGTNGELFLKLPEEMKNLRQKNLDLNIKTTYGKWSISENEIVGKPDQDYASAILSCKGAYLEINAKVKLGTAKKAGILVRCTDNLDTDVTGISVCKRTNSVYVEDLSGGFEAPSTRLWDCFSKKPSLPVSMPLINPSDEVDLRIIVDGSIIEVYINNEQALTARCYTKNDDAIYIGLFAVSGQATFSDFSVWELHP